MSNILISKLYSYLQYNDTYDMWLDANNLCMSSEKQLPSLLPDTVQSCDVFHSSNIVDAEYSIELTIKYITEGVQIIKSPCFLWEGILSTVPYLISKETLLSVLHLNTFLIPLSEMVFSPYIAFKCVSTVSIQDRYWNYISAHITLAIHKILELNSTIPLISGIRYNKQMSTHPFLLHWMRWKGEKEKLQYGCDWFYKIHSFIWKNKLFCGSCIDMCPVIRSSYDRSFERERHIYKELVRLKDITLVYKCGFTLRKIAWNLGARTYHDALRLHEMGRLNLPACSNEIICANPSQKPDKPIILPHIFSNKNITFFNNVICNKKWIATDFETVNVDQSCWIFMISCVAHIPYESDSKSIVFKMEELTLNEQLRVLKEWLDWMRTIQNNIDSLPVFHWAPAEQIFLRKVLKKYNLHSEIKELHQIFWVDMCAIFIEEKFAITDCFDYKLKHIAKTLYKYNKISHTWPSSSDSIVNGMEAMMYAVHYYQNNKSKSIMKNIQLYNEIDTFVLYDIVHFVCNEKIKKNIINK